MRQDLVRLFQPDGPVRDDQDSTAFHELINGGHQRSLVRRDKSTSEVVRRSKASVYFSPLFITHNIGVVEYGSNHMAVMRDGRIVEQGPTARIAADPQHPYTRQLLSAVPRVALSSSPG